MRRRRDFRLWSSTRRAFGGQAGASARIENYLGFPIGISGQMLTGRAYVQAQKFGAEMVIPTEVARLNCSQNPLTLELGDGVRAKAVAVVIASGARYRRLDVPNLREFEGRGVWYWASPIEARLCRREEIVLVGGGNSVGSSRRVLAPLRRENLAAGARAESSRKHVAISH